MDQDTLRAVSTILVMIVFIGVCWWAFAPSRRKRFRDAANLPFADEVDAKKKKHRDSGEDKGRDKL